MDKVAELRKNAEECRALARNAKGDERELLLDMAARWDLLASDRERFQTYDPKRTNSAILKPLLHRH
jgi:hypothetical protein